MLEFQLYQTNNLHTDIFKHGIRGEKHGIRIVSQSSLQPLLPGGAAVAPRPLGKVRPRPAEPRGKVLGIKLEGSCTVVPVAPWALGEEVYTGLLEDPSLWGLWKPRSGTGRLGGEWLPRDMQAG